MKKISIFVVLNLVTFILQAKSLNLDTPVEEFFDRFLKATTPQEQIQHLTNAIEQKKSRKQWARYPYAVFLRANLYKNNNQKNLAIKDYLFLTKKYKYYYEPWIELIFLLLLEDKNKDAYKLIKKSLKHSTISIITSHTDIKESDQELPSKIIFKSLQLELKATLEIFLDKKKKLKKTAHKLIAFSVNPDYKQTLNSKNSYLNNLNLNIILGLIDYTNGKIVPCREKILQAFQKNWGAELHPLFLLILEKHPNFRYFFLELKKEHSKQYWKKEWNQKRSNWQLNKWKASYLQLLS